MLQIKSVPVRELRFEARPAVWLQGSQRRWSPFSTWFPRAGLDGRLRGEAEMKTALRMTGLSGSFGQQEGK